ncbi:MAG: ATP-binding protein [Cytophagaceae bacterium]
MKIRHKIIIIYSILTAFILLALSIFVYIFSNIYTEEMFYTHLREKATLTAQIHLEQDELEHLILSKIREEHLLDELPEEVIEIYDENNKLRFVEEDHLTDSLFYAAPILNKIRKKKYLEFRDGERQCAGMLYHDNQGQFVIIVSAIDYHGIDKMKTLVEDLAMGFLLSIILVLIVGNLFARQILKPITKIVREVNDIQPSSLSQRIDEGNSRDELAQLAITFNKMLERLEKAFEGQRNFINNASHELKNPLTAILGQLEVTLHKTRTQEEYVQTLETVYKETERIDTLITELLNLAKTDYENEKLIKETVQVDEVVLNVISEVKHIYPEASIKVDYGKMPDQSSGFLVKGNAQLLRIVFMNLFENACKYSDSKPVTCLLHAEQGFIDVDISDQGIGIPDQEIQRVFQTFYRGENARRYKGSGLGLSLTEQIIRLHNGKMIIHSEVDEGTTVLVSLPAIG